MILIIFIVQFTTVVNYIARLTIYSFNTLIVDAIDGSMVCFTTFIIDE
jgi:hypothetical protein